MHETELEAERTGHREKEGSYDRELRNSFQSWWSKDDNGSTAWRGWFWVIILFTTAVVATVAAGAGPCPPCM